jgi:AbrB family looped-hinge helix DNA binding protein
MAIIGRSGRLVIPASFRKALGLEDGDGVTIELKEGGITIVPIAASVRKAQNRVKKYLKKDDDLVEMLFEERREAVKNEH